MNDIGAIRYFNKGAGVCAAKIMAVDYKSVHDIRYHMSDGTSIEAHLTYDSLSSVPKKKGKVQVPDSDF